MKKFFKTTALFLTFVIMLSSSSFAANLAASNPAYLYVYNSSSQTKTINLPKYSPFGENLISAQSLEEEGSLQNISKAEELEDGSVIYQNETANLAIYSEEMSDVSFFSNSPENYQDYSSQKVDFVSQTTGDQQYLFLQPATRFAQNEYCDVFFQDNAVNGKSFSDAEKTVVAQEIADEFENRIHSYVLNNIGDYMGNNGVKNGKIIILLEDIVDDYATKGSYTAGYYSSGKENYGKYGNNGPMNINMIHIDIYPLMYKTSTSSPNSENAFSTLSHEFTHLVENYVTTQNTGANYGNFNKAWFKEFFTLSVEGTLYSGENDASRARNMDFDSGIKDGAVLTFDNYATNNQSLAANYGLMYHLGKYINNRTGKSDVLKMILEAEKNASNCQEAFAKGVKAKDSSAGDMQNIIEDFYLAMTLCETGGKYYMGEKSFTKNFKLPLNFGGAVTLKPGAAVVVPLFGTDFNLSDAGLVVKKFSPNADEVPKNVYFAAKTMCYPPYLELTKPYIKINNKTAESYNDIRHVVFSIEDENLLGIISDMSYLIKGVQEKTVNIVGCSATDKNVFDTQKFIFAPNASATLNFYSEPAINKSTMSLESFDAILYSTDANEVFNRRIAVYDDKGMLLGYIGDDRRYKLSANAPTIFDVDIKNNSIKESYNGIYVLKMFFFDVNNDNLKPITNSLEVKIKP